jgi:hypothetical protein
MITINQYDYCDFNGNLIIIFSPTVAVVVVVVVAVAVVSASAAE